MTAAAVLFGVAFSTIARNIQSQIRSPLGEYLKISAYGVAVIFESLVANIAHGAYPPFGIASYSFTGLASYFFISGIYCSAISVAADSILRYTIRKSALDKSKLLDNISFAQMQKGIRRNGDENSKGEFGENSTTERHRTNTFRR